MILKKIILSILILLTSNSAFSTYDYWGGVSATIQADHASKMIQEKIKNTQERIKREENRVPDVYVSENGLYIIEISQYFNGSSEVHRLIITNNSTNQRVFDLNELKECKISLNNGKLLYLHHGKITVINLRDLKNITIESKNGILSANFVRNGNIIQVYKINPMRFFQSCEYYRYYNSSTGKKLYNYSSI